MYMMTELMGHDAGCGDVPGGPERDRKNLGGYPPRDGLRNRLADKGALVGFPIGPSPRLHLRTAAP